METFKITNLEHFDQSGEKVYCKLCQKKLTIYSLLSHTKTNAHIRRQENPEIDCVNYNRKYYLENKNKWPEKYKPARRAKIANEQNTQPEIALTSD